MCGGSGGGGAQETMGNWSPEISPYWHKYLDQGEQLAAKPYQQYGGQRIADFHPAQVQGLDRINTLANQGGTVVGKAATDQMYRTLAGDYLPGGISGNPYADQGNQFASLQNPNANAANPWADKSIVGDKVNPWNSVDVWANRNEFGGMNNPYFNKVVTQGLGDITNAYQQGTSADTTRQMNLAGVLGGGANQKAIANNEANLSKQLSNYVTGMQNTQYDRSAGLEEGYQGRNLSAQSLNKQLGQGSYDQTLNRDLQAQTANKSMGGQWWGEDTNRANADFENFINRMYGSGESQLARGSGAFENERGRMMGAVPNAQNDQANALQLYNAQVGVGDAYRGWNQDLMNQGYQDWQQQQNYPQSQMDWFTGLLSRSMGGMAPSGTTTQAGFQASPLSQIFGGLLGYKALTG